MTWIEDHKAPVSVLLILGVLLVGFFTFRKPAKPLISSDESIQIAFGRCYDPVMDSSLDVQAHTDVYKNVPPMHHLKIEPADEMLPVWIVTMDGYWIRSGGPPSEEGDYSSVTLEIYDRCTVVIDALTGDILLADVPLPIE